MKEFKSYPKPEKVLKISKPYRYERKATGEADFFKQIFKDRVNKKNWILYSEVSGEPIPTPTHANFHHVLSKKQYPQFRLEKKNIVVLTFQEHDDWHSRKESLRDKPEWKWVFDLEEELIDNYKILQQKS